MIDAADWAAFAEAYFTDSAAADLNLNNQIDGGDVDAFAEAFATGT